RVATLDAEPRHDQPRETDRERAGREPSHPRPRLVQWGTMASANISNAAVPTDTVARSIAPAASGSAWRKLSAKAMASTPGDMRYEARSAALTSTMRAAIHAPTTLP